MHLRRRRALLIVLAILVVAVTRDETRDETRGPELWYWGRRNVALDPQNPPEVRRREGALRVLFIGNSFTHYNGGLARIVMRLAAPSTGAAKARVAILEQSTEGGATLRWHWEMGHARERIAEGNWDYVVLQEHSLGPIEARGDFVEYAKRLDGEVRKVGARTVLFMTWPREGDRRVGEKVAAAYEALGRELKADVVPVGRAFMAARVARPAEVLYEGDGKHPSPSGSYLAGCCFYRYFYGEAGGLTGLVIDETGRKWIELGRDEAGFLQSVAAATVGGSAGSRLEDAE